MGRMTRYLHTMYRITDPEKSRSFYEALGLEFRRDMDIVRDGVRRRTTSSECPARTRSSS
jgi:catechol 2,3-dioxygenase-like lactoylglutathione lyase family enzyme